MRVCGVSTSPNFKCAPFSGSVLMQSQKCCSYVQVMTEYSDEQLDMVLQATEKLEAHLTAAVVSNDAQFTQKVHCPGPPGCKQ